MSSDVSDGAACVFHQLRARNSVPFGCEPIHFAHFRCGESFHKAGFEKLRASIRR
jgi:hypothetical protein